MGKTHLSDLNFTHTISTLSFGHALPGFANPLDDIWQHTSVNTMMYKYDSAARRCRCQCCDSVWVSDGKHVF